MNRLVRYLLPAAWLFAATANAAEPLSLDELLERVKQGRVADAKENAARIAAFQQRQAEQRQLLLDLEQQRVQQETRSQELEREFEANDRVLEELEQELKESLGSLQELFGVLQQAAGDARGQFENSLTQIQFPERTEFLDRFARAMGKSNRLASIDEIERLWFELQREMTEAGKVVRLQADVVTAAGEQSRQTVTRIGLFNVVTADKYLQYVPETQRLMELPRQPRRRYLSRLESLAANRTETVPVALDVTRGQILSRLVQLPSLRERIEQGGLVGYIIIALGALALLVALERLVSLSLTAARIRAQLRTPDQAGDNPLGRIIAVHQHNPRADVESLELRLGEAILKETPRLNRMLAFLKIIAVVAPLLGLLGTVVGMIVTFQAITLFGTGDPKLMAGGISQALVTTVLGLCVAIPTVLLHTLVAGRSRRLVQVLEEQAAGIVAEQAERQHRGSATV